MFDDQQSGDYPGDTSDTTTINPGQDGVPLERLEAQICELAHAGTDALPPDTAHSPPLPDPDSTIGDWHDTEITPDTIIPAWYGEHLDLDYAIYTSFANAGHTQNQTRQQHDQPEHALT